MADVTKVALLGLGRIGGQFARRVRALQAAGKPVKVVAVAERSAQSELAKAFAGDGVPVYADAADVLELGDGIDIVFDLTGSADVRASLRNALGSSGNTHTILAPEALVRFFWAMYEEGDAAGPLRDGY